MKRPRHQIPNQSHHFPPRPPPIRDELYGAGDVVWPASVALARLLAHCPSLVRGKRVLEIGAGLGLVGVAAMGAGASEVCFADVDAGVLAMTSRSAEHAAKKAARSQLTLDFLSRRSSLSVHPTLSIPTHLVAFRLRLTPLDAAPERRRVDADDDANVNVGLEGAVRVAGARVRRRRRLGRAVRRGRGAARRGGDVEGARARGRGRGCRGGRKRELEPDEPSHGVVRRPGRASSPRGVRVRGSEVWHGDRGRGLPGAREHAAAAAHARGARGRRRRRRVASRSATTYDAPPPALLPPSTLPSKSSSIPHHPSTANRNCLKSTRPLLSQSSSRNRAAVSPPCSLLQHLVLAYVPVAVRVEEEKRLEDFLDRVVHERVLPRGAAHRGVFPHAQVRLPTARRAAVTWRATIG
eukprot:31000-Pelagococcus_subviridis.AAC.10